MKIVKRGLVWAFAVFSAIMTFLSESIFSNCCIVNKEIIEKSKYFSWIDVDAANITIMKVLVFSGLAVTAILLSCVYSRIRKKTIKGNNYSIKVEYGNLLKKKTVRDLSILMNVLQPKLGLVLLILKKIQYADNI